MANAIIDRTDQIPVELGSLLERIDGFRHAESPQEPRDHPLVTNQVISAAKRLLRVIACEVTAKGLSWQNPAAGWDEDGRISLVWRSDDKALMFIIARNSTDGVVAVESRRGYKPVRSTVNIGQAIELAIGQLKAG